MVNNNNNISTEWFFTILHMFDPFFFWFIWMTWYVDNSGQCSHKCLGISTEFQINAPWMDEMYTHCKMCLWEWHFLPIQQDYLNIKKEYSWGLLTTSVYKLCELYQWLHSCTCPPLSLHLIQTSWSAPLCYNSLLRSLRLHGMLLCWHLEV